MSQKILVIGATGNVGHTLVKLLAEKGASVKAATRYPERYPQLTNVEAMAFDYDQPETYAPALAGVDRMFLIAKNADAEAHKTMTPFIDQAKAAGVKQAVLMTAMGVDQAPDEVAYRRVEKHLMASELDYTILRPNWFMQNFTRGFIFPMIQHNGGIYLPAGDAKTSLIDTHDIAEVAALVLTEAGHTGQEYTLTGGEALSYDEAAQIISQVTGRNIPYVAISDNDMRQALSQAGWYDNQVELMVWLFQSVQQGWAAPVLPTVAELLGRPPITFRQFAEANAEVWK